MRVQWTLDKTIYNFIYCFNFLEELLRFLKEKIKDQTILFFLINGPIA